MANASPPTSHSRAWERGRTRGARAAVLFCLIVLAAACAAPPPLEPSAETAASTPGAGARAEVDLPPTGSPQAAHSPGPADAAPPEPERVRVMGNDNQEANLRREPSTGAPVLKSVRNGVDVTIVGPDRAVEGRIWRNVQDGDSVGWIMATALRPVPTPTVTPSSVPMQPASLTPAGTGTTGAATATSTGTNVPPPTASATPETERVEVHGTGGQGANLRAAPGTDAPVLQTVPDGTGLTVIGPDRAEGGRTWRNVRGEDGATGWLIDEAVRPATTPTPSPPPAPPATAAATPTQSPSPTATPAVGPAAVPGSAGTPTAPSAPDELAPDAEPAEPTPEPERVEVYDTGTQGANLRTRAGLGGAVIRSVPDGSRLTVVGDDQVADGITWRNVATEDGTTGWLAQEVIRTVVTPTPTPRPGSAGIGAPISALEQPEEEYSAAERAATPCRPGQLKGDAATGLYLPPGHPDYAELRQRVRCFETEARAEASGFLLAPPPEPEAAPEPEPE